MNDIIYGNITFGKELFISKFLVKINNKLSIAKTLDNDNLINIFLDNYVLNEKDSVNKIIYNLNNDQTEGIKNIFNNNVSIVTGRAGTGKSSMLKGLVDCLAHVNKNLSSYQYINIQFLTPTAKAKLRITSVIGCNYNCSTIHSFIKKQKLLDNTIFVFDETSMIDVSILSELLHLLKHGDSNVFCFLGDDNQLPSISPGDVLRKLMSSKCFIHRKLNMVIRGDDTIKKVLNDVINGIPTTMTDESFNWIKTNSDKDIEKIIKKILNKNKETSILSTTNRVIDDYTDLSRDIVNPTECQDNDLILKFDKKETRYRIGDKVIHCKNINEKKLYNGMTGVITDICLVQQKNEDSDDLYSINKIDVTFDNPEEINHHAYFENELINLKPAYLITVHKAQGQEYDEIIFIFKNGRMVNKNLLYTALSRAKKKITLIALEETIIKALKTECKRDSLMDHMCVYYDKYHDKECFENYYISNNN